MDVRVQKLEGSRVELSVTIPWNEWEKEIDHAAESMAKNVKLPGFRPGKVPRAVVEQRFGREAISIEAAEHAVSHSYPKALAQEKIAAIGHPEFKLGEIREGEPIAYTVVTAVLPEVKLGDWKKEVKRVNAEEKKKSEALSIDESEIDEELKRLANMRAKSVTVRRPAKLDDHVEIDFTVTMDGTVIEGGKSERHPLVLGSGAFIPGFEDMIVGMQEGEEKTFTLSFPAEYHAKHLAGKPAEFSVKVRLVQEREVPAIDDAFAKSLGKFETLQAFKDEMRKGMLAEKKEKEKESWRTALLDAIVGEMTFECPDILLEEELRRMVAEFRGQVEMMGMPFAQYLEHTGKTEESLRLEWKDQAKKRIAAGFALDQLADENEIKVDSKEVEEAMNETLARYRSVKDVEKDLDIEKLYTTVQGQLRNKKVFEWIETL